MLPPWCAAADASLFIVAVLQRVMNAKHSLLEKCFDEVGDSILSSEDFKSFFSDNEYVTGPALSPSLTLTLTLTLPWLVCTDLG